MNRLHIILIILASLAVLAGLIAPATCRAAEAPADVGETVDVSATISRFASDDIVDRLAALETVAEAGKAALPQLIEALDAPQPMIRIYACRALARIPGPETRTAVAKLLQASSGPALKAVACETLAACADAESLESLRKAASEDASLYVRKSATLAIASLRTREAMDVIVWLLKNSEHDIRQAAAAILRSATKQDFGTSYEDWKKWWLDNKMNFRFDSIQAPAPDAKDQQ